jgi:hypothetical protein
MEDWLSRIVDEAKIKWHEEIEAFKDAWRQMPIIEEDALNTKALPELGDIRKGKQTPPTVINWSEWKKRSYPLPVGNYAFRLRGIDEVVEFVKFLKGWQVEEVPCLHTRIHWYQTEEAQGTDSFYVFRIDKDLHIGRFTVVARGTPR